MNIKIILKTTGIIFTAVSLFILYSCSKNADESLTDEQKKQQENNSDAVSIDEKDFSESDNDLTSVDYKEFYDLLSSHGEWIQIQAEEIGLNPNDVSSNESIKSSSIFSNLLSIKNAYTASDASLGMVYVWKPSALDLGVVRVEGELPVFTPYSNGQWINTDAGWYFKAPTPAEETVSHYGRWINSPSAGWMWVPGRVWSPAWVDWKQNDEYISWAPLPPSAYLANGVMSIPLAEDNNNVIIDKYQFIDDDSYTIVEKKYFLEPNVYKYGNVYTSSGNKILISDLTGTDGVMVVNNSIVNRGPDVNLIEYIYGKNIELVKIRHIGNSNNVRYSEKEYIVYSPGFKRYKINNNPKYKVIEPNTYKRYDEWKEKKSGAKDIKKVEDKIKKETTKIEKEIQKVKKEIIGKENKKNEKKNDTKKHGNKKNNNKK